MTITVALSAELSAQLQAYAQQLHLAPEIVVEQVLMSALPAQEANGVHGPDTPEIAPTDPADTELAAVIAQIKATPPNPVALQPAQKSVDELMADLQANPPSNELLTFAELWPLWEKFEQELKAADAVDIISEGRL